MPATWPPDSALASPSSSEPSHRLAGSGRWCKASSVPAAPVWSGATPRSCAACADAQWRSCAGKSSRPSPRPSARFLPAWQGVGVHAGRGLEALIRSIEQLNGAVLPASTVESVVLPSRVADYSASMLDELTSTGEVIWLGAGSLPGNDGWVSLHLADAAALTHARAHRSPDTPLHAQLLAELSGGGALFFRALAERVDAGDDRALAAALWDLVWSGHVTNDTFGPLRALLGSSRSRPAPPRGRRRPRPALAGRGGPPTTAGRWSATPERSHDQTRRLHATAENLLERHGIVTRGAVAAEHITGGFAAVYPVLKAFEATGRCRRGYFVEGLGGAQFALPGAVDRMRALTTPDERRTQRVRRAGSHRSRQPVRRGDRLARSRRHPPAGAQSRRAGRAGRRCSCVSTSSGAASRCFPTARTRPRSNRPRTPSRSPSGKGCWVAWRSSAPTARPS